MTFRIFVPIETLININLSFNLFTSTTFSTHFSATSTPTPANPTLPTPPIQKNLYLLLFSPSNLTPFPFHFVSCKQQKSSLLLPHILPSTPSLSFRPCTGELAMWLSS